MKEYTDIIEYIEKEILTYSNSQLILEIARADFHSSIGALEPRDAVSAENARKYFKKCIESIENEDDRKYLNHFLVVWLKRETEEVANLYREKYGKTSVSITNDDLQAHLSKIEKEWERERVENTRKEMEIQANRCGWNIDKLIQSDEEPFELNTRHSTIELLTQFA